jgi:C1A family cysteine protease
MLKSRHHFGWKKDHLDQRDFKYSVPAHIKAVPLPALVDLRSQAGPVLDQGQLGDCVGNAVCEHFEFNAIKQNLPKFNTQIGSRLFVYYNARVLESSVSSDSGCEIRDAIKTVATQGLCLASYWPYVISKFAAKPPASAYKAALPNKLVTYSSLDNTNLATLKGCLASGYPFVIGISVYASFESNAVAATGVVPMPGAKEQLLGGHALLCVGYRDAQQQFIVRNSWSASWGDRGNCYIPYAYLTSTALASDFWTIRTVS